MGIVKIYLSFCLSYLSCLLLIVCGDVESNPGPGSHKRVRILYSNIHSLLANLDELAEAGSDYDVLVCAVSKVSQNSLSLDLVATSVAQGKTHQRYIIRS